ncbi:MAG TPA: hypothetical protein VJ724_14200 [Tahibacter sp.]|nr:hypothetical protein [Tahibacter sp.]
MPLSNSALVLAALACAATAHAADGVPDPAFGDGGAAFVRPDDVEARQLHPYATQVLPDGKLLFGGFRSRFNPDVPFEPVLRAMLARLNADGSVDTGFGNTSIPGVAVLPDIAPDSRIQAIHAMHVLDDGRVVAAGTALAHAPATGFVVRLDAAGNVDATFGTQGFTKIAYLDVTALAVDTQGRIVVLGNDREDFARGFGKLVRLTPDGAPDPTFDGDGVLPVEWDGRDSANQFDALAIGAGDAIVVGGSVDTGDGPDSVFALARIAADGTYDPTFAGTGHRTFGADDIVSPVNHVERVVVAADGAIAFSGQYTNAGGKRALVLGRVNADGTSDAAFGDPATPGWQRPAIVPDAFGVDTTGLVMQPDGKLVVSVTYFSPTVKKQFLALRTDTNGALDATFADAGIYAHDLAPDGDGSETGSLALQPDGKLVVAGAAGRQSPLIDLAVVRLVNTNLVPDAIFADGFE